jgi:hypothetical protein
MISKVYKFNKQKSRWYIDIPHWSGSQADLEMVAGADTFLEKIAEGRTTVNLLICDYKTRRKNMERLYLFDQNGLGGANYYLTEYKGESFDHKMWLCPVTLYVFNQKYPEIIYFKEI